MQWVLKGRRVLRRALRRGSKKGLSRRPLEGKNTSFQEYDPLRVRPKYSYGKLRFSMTALREAQETAGALHASGLNEKMRTYSRKLKSCREHVNNTSTNS